MKKHINSNNLSGGYTKSQSQACLTSQNPLQEELTSYFSKSNPNDCGLFKFIPEEDKDKYMQYLKCMCIEKPQPEVIQKTDIHANGEMLFPKVTSREMREFAIDNIIKEIDGMSWLIRYHFNFYMCFGIVYTKLDDDYFLNMVYNYGLNRGINLSNSEAYRICSAVKMHTPDFPGEPDEENLTLFLNGFVDNATGQIPQYVFDYFPTVYVNANYIPTGKLYHPQFDAFLAKLCNNDMILIKRMWEVIGYTISSDNQAKRFFLLIGEKGNNGKSTWLEFLENLLPYTAVSHLSMGNLLTGRFSQSELFLKRINISGDEGYCTLNNEQIGELKRLTGGKDRITADVKNHNQISFKPTCKLFEASNYNLTANYSASGEAIVNRMCTIPFNAVIDNSEKDPHIVEKLITEKDAIVSEAFKHYLALRRRGYVFTGDDIYDVKYVIPGGDAYSKVADFCNNYCCFDNEEKFTYTDELYESFKSAYGNIFPDSTSFSQCFNKICENTGYKTEKKRLHTINKNAWGFKGVVLK